jgi:tripartite-type tricarboxylate transporter receptor subunit TctC
MGLLSLATLFFVIQISWAKFPEKPITAIMCWSAGGTIDLSFRPLAAAAGKILGQQIIIETKPGGAGGVGMGLLKTRKADGYNMGVTTISTLIHQHMNKVPYDLLKDFMPIMQYSDAPYGIAVLANAPWKTFKEFVDYAKGNPGKIRFSSSSPGDPGGFLTMSTLANKFQVDWIHVPFEGGMPGMAALLGGHVEAYAATLGIVTSNVRAGKLRLLVTFGEKRMEKFPDVPTLKELGIPIVAPSFSAIFAPKGISPENQETLHQAFKKAMEDPEFHKGLEITDKGFVYRNPKDAAAHFLEADEEIRRIMRAMKPQKE